MTVHHLLTHTAGLSYGFFYDTPIDDMYRESIFRSETASLEEKVLGMADLPLRHQPGAAWNYSIATDVCGYLVQVLADMPFEEFLAPRDFRSPRHGRYGIPRAGGQARSLCQTLSTSTRPMAASANMKAGQTYRRTTIPDRRTRLRAGAVWSRPSEDYWRFAKMLLNRGESNGRKDIGTEDPGVYDPEPFAAGNPAHRYRPEYHRRSGLRPRL